MWESVYLQMLYLGKLCLSGPGDDTDWMHAVGDLSTALAYSGISATLLYILWKRWEKVYGPIAWRSAAFIFSCGATHFFHVVAAYYPIHGFLGLLKLFTGAISLEAWRVLWNLKRMLINLPTQVDLNTAEQRSIDILNRTGSLLVAENDLDKIVHVATESARELSAAAYAAFFYNTTDAEGDKMTLVAVTGAPAESFTKFGYPRAVGIFVPTFSRQEVLRSDDITLDPRYGKNSPNKGLPTGHPPVRSYMSMPVVSRSGEVLGAMLFGHPDAGVFTERSEQFVRGLAAQTAIVIDNYRAHATLEATVSRRTQELEAKNAELQRTYEELGRKEKQYREMFERSPAPMYALCEEGRIQLVSQSWLDLMQYTREEVIGRPITDFHCPTEDKHKFSDAWENLLQIGELRDFEGRMCSASGRTFDVLISAVVFYDNEQHKTFSHTMNVVIDITARKEAEKIKLQAEKLAAVGQTVGGVAHDFKNIAMAFDAATISLDRHYGACVRGSDRGNKLLDSMADAANRAKSMCQRLLFMARRDELHTERVKPSEVVEAVRIAVASTLATSNVETSIGKALDLPCVVTDRAQLEVVLINMAINARDAMPNGGNLVFRAVEEHLESSDPPLAAGRYLKFEISDTGVGMDKETAKKALEPFFTTKPKGKGTGLGLSMAYDFARNYGGDLRIESALGKGTTIRIWIPAAKD